MRRPSFSAQSLFAISFLLNLLMQPALSALERLGCPGFGIDFAYSCRVRGDRRIGAAVSGPAEAWIAKLPEGGAAAPFSTPRQYASSGGGFAPRPQRSSPGPLDGGAIVERLFRDASFPAGCSRP